MNNSYKDLYLQHHGINGQRWGKKNGPPYPLNDSDHSASEKKAGWRKSLDKKPRRKPDDTKSYKVDDFSKLSDDELKARVDRLLMEEKYKKLVTVLNETKSSRARDSVKKAATKIITDAITKAITDELKTGIKTGLNKGEKAISKKVDKIIKKMKP